MGSQTFKIRFKDGAESGSFCLRICWRDDGIVKYCAMMFFDVDAFMRCSEDEKLFYGRYKSCYAEEKWIKKSDLDEVRVEYSASDYDFLLARGETREFKMIPRTDLPHGLLRALYPDPYQRARLRLEGLMLEKHKYDGCFCVGLRSGLLYEKAEYESYTLAIYLCDEECYEQTRDCMRTDGCDLRGAYFCWGATVAYGDVSILDSADYKEIGGLLGLGAAAQVHDSVSKLLHRILTNEEAEAFIWHD